jgi:hypothetical protein
VGSKPKRLVISPGETANEFVTPVQGHLFKVAREWQAQQLWCEVVAYELSYIVNVTVPPAYVAVDSAAGETGALIELFYPYPSAPKTTRLIHAADFMQRNFADGKKGRPHALRENLVICRGLHAPDFLTWWAEAILFDTLIGNTDRHSENWGFLIERESGDRTFRLAPLYDNGTSLGYGIQDQKLAEAWAADRMAAHIARGRHDIGWNRIEDGPTPHLDLCIRFFTAYPDLRAIAERMLGFDDDAVQDITDWAADFDVPVRFAPERGRFIIGQIGARRDALKGALGL